MIILVQKFHEINLENWELNLQLRIYDDNFNTIIFLGQAWICLKISNYLLKEVFYKLHKTSSFLYIVLFSRLVFPIL